MSWRTNRRTGKHFPQSGRKNTIYSAAEDRHIASEVMGGTTQEARTSVDELAKEFREAKTREKKEHLWRAVQEEANRAEIASQNPRNGTEARMRQREVETIFRREAERMHRELYQ